jgi:hypothetical protein
LLVTHIGDLARRDLQQRARHTIALANVDCSAPGDLTRHEFLDEVQYLAGLPDRLNLLDDRLPVRLAEAFAQHPWVARVERVELLSSQVRVALQFRTAVLWVAGPQGNRAVDARGVVLPARAATADVPRLQGDLAPAAPAGRPWADSRVAAAAATAAFLRPYRQAFQCRLFAASADGLVLWTGPGTQVVWGSPPGRERPDEPAAARKVEQLMTLSQQSADSSAYVYDLRRAQPKVSSTNCDQVSNSSR